MPALCPLRALGIPTSTGTTTTVPAPAVVKPGVKPEPHRVRPQLCTEVALVQILIALDVSYKCIYLTYG